MSNLFQGAASPHQRIRPVSFIPSIHSNSFHIPSFHVFLSFVRDRISSIVTTIITIFCGNLLNSSIGQRIQKIRTENRYRKKIPSVLLPPERAVVYRVSLLYTIGRAINSVPRRVRLKRQTKRLWRLRGPDSV